MFSDILPAMREISRTELSKSKDGSRANALFGTTRRRREKVPYLTEAGFILEQTDHVKLAESFIYPPEGAKES